jgi:hypothetical protein
VHRANCRGGGIAVHDVVEAIDDPPHRGFPADHVVGRLFDFWFSGLVGDRHDGSLAPVLAREKSRDLNYMERPSAGFDLAQSVRPALNGVGATARSVSP